MATYYIDFENGNDANTGLSFAQRWKTITNGATGARIAAGDEIRIMASPDPTSIGNATWTGGGRPAAISIASSTNATPIVITTSIAHGLVPGDYVTVYSHTTNTNANGVWKVGTTPTSTSFQILQIDGTNTTGNGAGGASGFIVNIDNCIVKTATPLVQNIAMCGGLAQKQVWTSSVGVTTTRLLANGKEGYSYPDIGIGSTFTTGKAAYYTLPSTLDLSAYQQVSFWFQQYAGTLTSGSQAYIALCTDTIGNTVAHQCFLPNPGVLGQWMPVVVDLGTNLNSAIRSVALYISSDVGAQSFYFDNIIACKAASSADSINLTSLISKSDGTGDEAWYPIQSINYDAIMLANSPNYMTNNGGIKGYDGATETVTTYKRETIKTTPGSGATSQISVINDSGTAGSPITFSGGWNRTDMSTQTGITWLDGQNGYGYGLYSSAKNYTVVSDFGFCRYYTGYHTANLGPGNAIDVVYATGCSNISINLNSTVGGIDVGSIWINNNGTGLSFTSCSGVYVQNVKNANSNDSNGVIFSNSYSCSVGILKANNCGATTSTAPLSFTASTRCSVGYLEASNSKFGGGIYLSSSVRCSVGSGFTSGNLQGIRVAASTANDFYTNNFTINETQEVMYAASIGGDIYANRLDDTDNNSWVWFGGIGTINQQTSVVDSPATTAWLMRPTSGGVTSTNPIRLKLGTVVCAANSLVTITARMRRDDTGLTMRLVCPGGQISGVSSDVTSDMTAAANTWETVTIAFTPTKAGAVDIYAYAFGGSTYSGYVCNLTASQA